MVFLVFDLFGRNEKAGYLAYLVALVPVNYLWGIEGDPLMVYIILFSLWIITLLRDTIGVYLDKNKDINEILLYLFLAIIIQLIITAIMPEVNENLQLTTEKIMYFWVPNVHSAIFLDSLTLTFKIVATVFILLIVIPLIIDVKDEEAPLPIVIIFVAIFILPFLYLSYIWVPEIMAVLTFLFSVILFIILLMITKKE
ncbi:unnamed protein product [marine sediment metagenome]|uniref:Uncharacterized protein n=1 Tax=marine sediment metagenome TaxID=412755 RepID=X1D349_9ZZZZ